MYSLMQRLLFRLDPEDAHHAALRMARASGSLGPLRSLLARAAGFQDPRLVVEALGLRFENPLGLAAGYDKDGRAVAGLSALGFGHLELGTVTRVPQAGNPRPRVRRFEAARAIVNSMGFPNAGVEALMAQRFEPRGRCLLGINVGKNKDTPLERAAEEYALLIERVAPRADYVAVNISSPNTPGLRKLQDRAALEALLGEVAAARGRAARRVPVLVKIAPDLSESEVDDVLEAVSRCSIDGVIASNTTTDRSGLPASARDLPGGTSGEPLRARAEALTRFVARRTHGRLPLVGVGGIMTPEDALERLRAGAHLVQVYTGLVYGGPFLVRRILEHIARACAREGLASCGELGAAARR